MVLEEFLNEWRNDSPTVLVHTSGSTGKPKPMWAEKEKMLNSARVTCDFLGLKPGDTALLCMPLDYIAGKMVVVRVIALWTSAGLCRTHHICRHGAYASVQLHEGGGGTG